MEESQVYSVNRENGGVQFLLVGCSECPSHLLIFVLCLGIDEPFLLRSAHCSLLNRRIDM